MAPDDLTNAVGLNSASFNVARIVGPAIAGLSIAALGSGVVATGWVILANGLSYAAPILTLHLLDQRALTSPEPVSRAPGAIRAGVAYVRSRPDLMLILGIVFFTGTFGLNFQMTSALMATQVYGKGPTEFGLLGTFLAVGSLTGALLAARRTRVRQRMVVGAAITFGAVEMVAGMMPSYVLFAVLCPVMGLCALTMITSANAFMQLHTDPGMRGRVMALYMMIFIGGTPIGAPAHRLGGGGLRGPLDPDRGRPAHGRRGGRLGAALPPSAAAEERRAGSRGAARRSGGPAGRVRVSPRFARPLTWPVASFLVCLGHPDRCVCPNADRRVALTSQARAPQATPPCPAGRRAV